MLYDGAGVIVVSDFYVPVTSGQVPAITFFSTDLINKPYQQTVSTNIKEQV